jgi:uncharacterized membrane protein
MTNTESIWFGIYIAAAAIACAVIVVGIITAAVQIVKSKKLDSTARLIWLAIVVVVPIIGTLVWFAARPGQDFVSRVERQLRHSPH